MFETLLRLCLSGLHVFYFYGVLLVLLGPLLALIAAVFYKPLRWYLLSFKFAWLYKHPKVARLLGMNFVNINDCKIKRNSARIYMTGGFVKFFGWFTGLNVNPSSAHRIALTHLQGKKAKEINLEPYFNEWTECGTLDVNQLEDKLSNMILTETNRVFKVMDKDMEDELKKHLRMLRYLIGGLTGGEFSALTAFRKNWRSLWKLRKLLWKLEDVKRTLIVAPQLTFVSGFMKMLVLKDILKKDENGKEMFTLRDDIDFNKVRRLHFRDIEPYMYLEPSADFIVFVIDGVLTFVGDRKLVKDNTQYNTNFGPRGFQCPGKLFTMKSIHSVAALFKAMEYDIIGKPELTTGRYRDVTNKSDVRLTFYKVSDFVKPLDENPDYSEIDPRAFGNIKED